MKVGSLVKCIKSFDDLAHLYPGGVKLPVKGKDYVVRDVITFNDTLGIQLEEIVLPEVLTKDAGKREQYFLADAFRELLPPDALTEELKELIKEKQTA